MNPRQIEAFRSVMRLGSMTNAADVLGISQPAVSRLVRDLEANLQLRLFRREGNRLAPTHEARVLFEEVDLHYRGLAHIEKAARDLRGGSAGALRIAAPSALATFVLPDVAADFLAERPTVAVSIATASSPLIVERVGLRQLDVGLVQLSGEHPGVRVVALPRPAAVCILHRDHPLASQEIVTPRLLANQAFISLGRDSPMRVRVDALFAESGVERIERIEADLAAAVQALVARGLGVSIVDPFVASAMDDRNIVVRPFRPTIPFEAALVVPARRSLSDHAQRFVDLIRIRFRKRAGRPLR